MSSAAMKITILLAVVCFFCLTVAEGTNNPGTLISVNVTKDQPFLFLIAPPALTLDLHGEDTLSFYYKRTTDDGGKLVLWAVSVDETIASVKTASVELKELDILPDANTTLTNVTASGNITLRGEFLGYTELKFYVCDNSSRECNGSSSYQHGGVLADDVWLLLEFQYDVTVIRKHRLVDDIFRATIAILVIFINVAMGCKVQLDIVKEVLRKPVAPAIGFCCQFAFMPVLSYAVAKLASLSPGETIGVFTLGCSPGGGASNIYTYLIGGDVSLSITMTLISTFASFAMVPLWMFTLGRYILEDLGRGEVNIPYTNIIATLAGILLPVVIGIVIQKKAPKVAKYIKMIIRPFLFVFLLFMFTFGVWVNWPLFQLFNTRLAFAGFTLPLFGFASGGIVAAICRLSWKRVKTIALETGIQNTGVAIVMLLFSLPAPESDFSIIGCIAISTCTPIGPLSAAIFYEVKRRCEKKKEEKGGDGGATDGTDGDDENKEGEEEMKDVNKAANGSANEDDSLKVDRQHYRRRSSQVILPF
ncbi:sodium-dependent organic anion transporter-like [Lineus longissimus]|uniref:sodium-dependent organic anion transporter-like n=1 Tax=Lineus longissimus TaxID=88925 RepID=UPI002B4F59AE